jgi:hypothetical protein
MHRKKRATHQHAGVVNRGSGRPHWAAYECTVGMLLELLQLVVDEGAVRVDLRARSQRSVALSAISQEGRWGVVVGAFPEAQLGPVHPMSDPFACVF